VLIIREVSDATLVTDIMEQVDSIYIDKLTTDEWQVEALCDCFGCVRTNACLIDAIKDACLGAILEASKWKENTITAVVESKVLEKGEGK